MQLLILGLITNIHQIQIKKKLIKYLKKFVIKINQNYKIEYSVSGEAFLTKAK